MKFITEKPLQRPQRLIRLSNCLLLFTLTAFTPLLVSAAEIYLHPQGNDQTGDGSLQRPYRTLSGAESSQGNTAPGTRFLLRGGVYDWDNAQNLSLTGTADEPIVITAYQDESPQLDGLDIPQSGNVGRENNSVINLKNSSHIVVEKLEVLGSSGRGISFYDSEHVVIRDNNVHDVQSRAIGGSGAHITIEGNTVWSASMHHAGGDLNDSFVGGGWAGAISTWLRPDNRPSSDITIKNNAVYNSWGEGIIALWADGVVITGNTVHDTFSINVYVDHARDVEVTANHLYSANSKYYRRNQPASAVSIGNEDYGSNVNGIINTKDILIANNLMVNTSFGISFWYYSGNSEADNTYQNLQVINNTIVNPAQYAIRIKSVGGRDADGVFRNNLVDAPAISQAVSLEELNAWTFSNNNWVQGLPGVNGEQNSIAENPLYNGGNPTIVSNFVVPPNSPNVGTGTQVTGVNKDYFGVARPANPSIGFSEPVVTESETACVLVDESFMRSSELE